MRVPPRPARQGLFDAALLLRAYGFLGVLEAGIAMATFFFVLHRGGWSYRQPLAASDPLYRQATTACLIAIVLSQVVNVLVCRTGRTPALRAGRAGLGIVLAGVVAELGLVLLIAYSRPGQLVVGTAPVGPGVWVFVLPLVLAMFALDEARKWLVHRLGRNTGPERPSNAATAGTPHPDRPPAGRPGVIRDSGPVTAEPLPAERAGAYTSRRPRP
jgi:magnesium-transporting ATPase (P-type)